jgi:hypothetical protein
MATARRKPTPPAKKPTRADERSEVHGVRVKSPARKRALENGGGASRPPAIKPGATGARKPARRAADERPRAPRSTKRSALPEAVATPHAPKRRARRARHDDGAENKRAAARGASTGHAPAKARRRAENNPLATSIGVGAALLAPSGELRALVRDVGSARPDHEPDTAGRVMELHWGDDVPSSRRSEGIVQRWVKRGDALLRHLAEHGAARHEYRADLKDGRFVWVDADGRVSAEAQVQVLCSWSRSTSALAMAWADPLVRAAGIGRVDGMPGERDDVDEEAAWRVAMEAADIARAEYLYRVTTPHAWYFLALSGLTFHPERASFSPSTPVGLVLRGLAEMRSAVESRAEPAEVVRHRIEGLGQALLLEAEYAYRGTDWVARLERAGRRLVSLGEQLPRASFKSVAAGQSSGEWLDRQETIDLSDAIALLEDEWALFA